LLFILLIHATAQAAQLGDVTGDGRVAVDDAVKLLRFAVNIELPTDAQAILGDVAPRPGPNGRRIGDQRLNVQDVSRILRYTVGLVSKDEFGANDQYLALSPPVANLGPLDQAQFTAVPVNFDAPVEWSLGNEVANPGQLSVTGLYIAPSRVTDDFLVSVHARAGTQESVASVYVSDVGPPPPPPG
jgi:hypothetical protein